MAIYNKWHDDGPHDLNQGIAYAVDREKGRFSFKPERIELSGSGVKLLDAVLTGSAAIEGYISGGPRFELASLSGTVGSRATQWVYHTLQIPDGFQIQTPYTITTAGGTWSRQGGLHLKGDVTWAGALRISAALTSTDGEFNLEHARIRDEFSDAVVRLKHTTASRQWDLRYSGHLEKQSLAKLWSEDRMKIGKLQGDITVRIQDENVNRITAEGALEAEEVMVTGPVQGPFVIHAIALDAHGTAVDIKSMDLSWREQRLALTGKADVTPKNIQLDLAISADGLDAGVLAKAFTSPSPTEIQSDFAPPSQAPVISGKIALNVGRLSYERYLVNALKADLTIMDDHTVIDVAEANLCGISTSGHIDWTPEGIQLNIFPRLDQQPLESTSGCLTGDLSTERLEGTAEIKGNLTSRGQNQEELLHHLQGLVQVHIQNGRVVNVGRVGFFTNLLSFIKLNNLLSGSAPHFKEKDFPYKSISAQFVFEKDMIKLEEGKLFADALNMAAEGTIHPSSGKMDLTVLISPLTTIDTVVRHTPVIGNILQGTLVAFPVGVSGRIEDPAIIPLSPKPWVPAWWISSKKS